MILLRPTDTFQSSILSLGGIRTLRSWPELLIAEPRLRSLAQAVGDGYFGTDPRAWSRIKAKLDPIIGHGRTGTGPLCTSGAHEIATRELQRIMARRPGGRAR